MATDSSASVARLTRWIHERSGSLLVVLEDYTHRDYPSVEVSEFLSALKSSLGAVGKKADELGELAVVLQKDPAAVAGIERKLRRYGQVIKNMHETVAFLRDSEIYHVPTGLCDFLKRWARKHHPDTRISVHATSHYNFYYAPLAYYLRPRLFALAGLPWSFQEDYGVLSLPRAEQRNPLAATLLAHEVGHYLYYALDIPAEVEDLSRNSGAWDHAENLFVARAGLDVDKLNRLWMMFHSFLAEFIADRIGLYAAGPAFFLASVDLDIVNDDPGMLSRSHPADSDRLFEMIRFLKQCAWSPLVKELLSLAPWVEGIADGARMRTLKEADATTDSLLALVAVRDTLDIAFETVDETFGGAPISMQAAEFFACRHDAFELLDGGIPPGELLMKRDDSEKRVLVPLRESTILLLGWMFCLSDLEAKWGPLLRIDGSEEDPRHRLVSVLDDHIEKALEISAARGIWGDAA